MTTATQQLRNTLRAYEAERTERVLQRAAGQDPGPPSLAQRRRADWLLGEGADEALERVRDGEGTDGQGTDGAGAAGSAAEVHEALTAQRDRIRARACVVEAESAVRTAWYSTQDDPDGESSEARLAQLSLTDAAKARKELGRRALQPLHGAVLRLQSGHREAAERWPRAYPAVNDEQRCAAAGFLAATDAMTSVLVAEHTAPWQAGSEISWDTLVRSLRQEHWDGHCRASNRYRRLAASATALGLSQHLGRRVRVAHAERLGSEPTLVVRAMPADIRILTTGRPGLLADLAGRRALGRALAWSLTAAAVPWERAYPGWGGAGPALGGLLMGWMGDRQYLRRLHGLGGREGERLARAAAVAVLLRARMSAVYIAEPQDGRDPQERLEWRASQLSHALGCRVSPTLAGLLWTGHGRLRDAALGDLRGLAWHGVLREHYDEDCFRNPRAAEALRAACEPGLQVDLESTLGGGQALADAAVARLHELLVS